MTGPTHASKAVVYRQGNASVTVEETGKPGGLRPEDCPSEGGEDWPDPFEDGQGLSERSWRPRGGGRPFSQASRRSVRASPAGFRSRGCRAGTCFPSSGLRVPRREGAFARGRRERHVYARRLWTQARESLDVTTVIFSNRRYAILEMEYRRVGAGEPSPKAQSLFDLSRPDLDWVSLARGMGVDGARAGTAEELAQGLERGLSGNGPYLIEAVL